VGCDLGLFVQYARDEAAMDAAGVDLSERIAARGRAAGLAIVHGTLEGAKFGAESFDAVCAFDLIEHVADPRAWMREAARILRPGGVLAIETPNYQGLAYATGRLMARVPGARRLFQPLLERLWPAFHVQYFTRHSLERLIAESGLRPARIAARELSREETAVSGWLRPLILSFLLVGRAVSRPTLLAAVARKPH
jgi:SAM-dependent methyltransferase